MRKTIFFALILILNCAITSTNTRYIPGDPINNEKYFGLVHEHFVKIGQKLSSEEELKYTGRIFFASLPPICEIYADSQFVGKSNIGLIYLKPGKNKFIFKKGSLSFSGEIVIKEGDNPSLMVKLK